MTPIYVSKVNRDIINSLFKNFVEDKKYIINKANKYIYMI